MLLSLLEGLDKSCSIVTFCSSTFYSSPRCLSWQFILASKNCKRPTTTACPLCDSPTKKQQSSPCIALQRSISITPLTNPNALATVPVSTQAYTHQPITPFWNSLHIKFSLPTFLLLINCKIVDCRNRNIVDCIVHNVLDRFAELAHRCTINRLHVQWCVWIVIGQFKAMT